MATLYDITARYIDLLNVATDANVTEEEVDAALNALDGEIEDKVSGGIAVIQELKHRAAAIDAEIKRLSQMKKTTEARIEHIKQYYFDNLTSIGKTKIWTDRGTMTIAKSGGKRPLVIDDEDLIPFDFKQIVSTTVIDKDTIREALERGVEVDGAHLGERTKYLKIS